MNSSKTHRQQIEFSRRTIACDDVSFGPVADLGYDVAYRPEPDIGQGEAMPPSQHFSSGVNLISTRLVELKNAGATPIEAIKTLRLEFVLSLAEAKNAFAASPVWFAEVTAGDALHAEIFGLDDRSRNVS